MAGWKSGRHLVYVHNACSAHSFPLFSCVVLAPLTTRLTDSVDHPSARNSLAVPTLLMAIPEPSRQLPQAAAGSRPEAPVPPDPLWSGTWRHGGLVSSCVGFLEHKELTPVTPRKSERTRCKTACTLVVVTSQKSIHQTLMCFFALLSLLLLGRLASFHFAHTH